MSEKGKGEPKKMRKKITSKDLQFLHINTEVVSSEINDEKGFIKLTTTSLEIKFNYCVIAVDCLCGPSCRMVG